MAIEPKRKFIEGILLGALGGFFLVVMIWGWNHAGRSYPSNNQMMNSAAPVYSQVTMDIASKFDCSCGDCSNDPVSDCDCSTSQATRRFIERNVQNGLPESEIIDRVQSTFGNYRG